MAEPKCAVHEERLTIMEERLERIEDSLGAITKDNHSMATGLAVAERSFELFQSIVTRLESRIETLEKRIEALLKDRWQIIAGLLGNAAIGATSIVILVWIIERVIEK